MRRVIAVCLLLVCTVWLSVPVMAASAPPEIKVYTPYWHETYQPAAVNNGTVYVQPQLWERIVLPIHNKVTFTTDTITVNDEIYTMKCKPYNGLVTLKDLVAALHGICLFDAETNRVLVYSANFHY